MRRLARALLPLLALTSLAAVPAGAQAPVATWTLQGVADRMCIAYLVEPAIAAKELGGRFTPLPAERAEGLHPAVAQVVANEPAYRGWVPAEVCVIEAAQLSAGTRSAQGNGKPIVLGYAALAAVPAGGGPAVMSGTLFSTSGNARRLAGDQLIHVAGVKYSRGPVPDGAGERRTLSYRGATVTWDGRVVDPVAEPTPRPTTLAVEGKRNRQLAVGIGFAAEWERGAVGNLKVRGKSDFARGLIGSPIRMVGPVTGGGTVTLDFQQR